MHVPHKASEYKRAWADHDRHRDEMDKILSDYAEKIKRRLVVDSGWWVVVVWPGTTL